MYAYYRNSFLFSIVLLPATSVAWILAAKADAKRGISGYHVTILGAAFTDRTDIIEAKRHAAPTKLEQT
jgi:hypothetical protein